MTIVRVLPFFSLAVTLNAWCPGYLDILTNVNCAGGSDAICPPETNISTVSITVAGGVRAIHTSRCAPYKEWTCAKSPIGRPPCQSPVTFKVPADPVYAKEAIPVGLGLPRGSMKGLVPLTTPVPPFQGAIGVLITGVPIYSPATQKSKVSRSPVKSELDGFVDVREGASEIEDFCGGFTDEDGLYHIHRLPRRVVWAQRDGDRAKCALPHDDQTPPGMHSNLLGYMLDGFAIYGPRNPQGEPSKDLDECGGHEGHESGPIDYHYHFTDEYPFSIECFRGCPLVNSGNSKLDSLASKCVKGETVSQRRAKIERSKEL